MTLAVAFVAVAANAQVYVGGSVGIASSKQNGGKNVTTYQVLPEIGYNINKDVAIGTVVGWGKGNPVNIQNEVAIILPFNLMLVLCSSYKICRCFH